MPDVEGRCSELIEASRDRCVAVLLDVERYPRWYDTFDEVTVLEHDPEGRPERLAFAAQAGPLGNLRVELRYAYDLPGLITGRQTGGDGNVRDLSSTWLLELESPGTTRVTFALEASAGNWKTKAAFRMAGPLVRTGLIDAFPRALKTRMEQGETLR